MAELKKTRVTGSYRRVIQTQQFFSVEVQSGFDEEVVYRDEAEVDVRRAVLRDKAMGQLFDDLEMIKQRLGVEEKRVFVRDSNKQTTPMARAALGADID